VGWLEVKLRSLLMVLVLIQLHTDRDEYPSAAFLENGGSAHLKCISRSDNRGTGRSFASQYNNHGFTLNDQAYYIADGSVIEFVISP
jgi:hypothetical protein